VITKQVGQVVVRERRKMCVKCYSRKLEGFDYKANFCRYELRTAVAEIHKEYGLDIVKLI
jgi:hypothetical protein